MIKSFIKLSAIGLVISSVLGWILWAPPYHTRTMIYYSSFLFVMVPLIAGWITAQLRGGSPEESWLLGVCFTIFLLWMNLGVLVNGGANASIPVFLAGLGIATIIGVRPDMPPDYVEEMRQDIVAYLMADYHTYSNMQFLHIMILLSPFVFSATIFMFFTYLGGALGRTDEEPAKALTEDMP